MKNSREQGILTFDIKGVYKVNNGGDFAERKEVICRDINSKTEGIGADLEQDIMASLGSMGGEDNRTQKEKDEEKKKSDAFFSNDSPSHKDVNEMAQSLILAFTMANKIKKSVFIKSFSELVKAGAISTTGDVVMTMPVWDKMKFLDKEYVAFMYCAFFANPLERL